MSEVAEKPDSLSATLGLEHVIDDGAASGRAVLRYRARMDHCHSGGIVQGGFITGWIDAAMAHVVIAKSGRQLSPLSLEIKISFMQSARPGPVIAQAWIERMGKTTAFLEGRLLNEQGEVLAKGTSTARLVPLPKGPLL
ncbi:MAG: PaaI family thioesterase [Alphaproteobacteria bacterium]|nr:PaaI family thioesterase [Alphaproteobacteria bacterium]MBL6938779.1 PaaI family thioesterase [Alphaproteobacteria bacterium]MBL7097864.1 PaaI family thioesterase [Alphaproteobacteria bacterium]